MFSFVAYSLVVASGVLSTPAPEQATHARIVAAAIAGVTPEALAAAGCTASEVTAVLDQLVDSNACGRLELLTSNLSPPSENDQGQQVNSEVSQRRAVRKLCSSMERVVAASVGSEKAAKLRRASLARSWGLAAEYGVAVSDEAKAAEVAAALRAEERAQRLGRTLGDQQQTLLTAVRASSEYTAAVQAKTDRLVQIRAVFGLSAE